MAPIPEIPVNDKVLHFFGVSRMVRAVELSRSADLIVFYTDGCSYLSPLFRHRGPGVSIWGGAI